MIHTANGFGIVNKAEVDVFLEVSCFFDDPTGVDNLISGSSAFSKSRFIILDYNKIYCLKVIFTKFGVLILLVFVSG